MMDLIGSTVQGFVVITLVLMAGCAFMTGQAVAETWRPRWQTAFYVLLLGLADRFLSFAMFDGELLNPVGYVVDTAILMAVGVAADRATRARKMANQYPWLYERVGLFGWRERGGGGTT